MHLIDESDHPSITPVLILAISTSRSAARVRVWFE